MTRALTSRIVTMASMLALASACTLKDQEAPALTGPSEFAQSISVAASPDVLPQDGASQSFITITARDENGQPIRNLTMRTETRVFGTPIDFGTLSARSVVTGSDGRATLVYTAPPSPAISPDEFILVDIVVTPFGTDFNNASQRSASIRLVPQGTVIHPFDLTASFTFTPEAPLENQTVLFNASASSGSIVEYNWEFGDGRRGSGRTAPHAYATAGTYVARLTVVDEFGRTATTVQSITVGAGTAPTASFTSSPTDPLPGTRVFFNASASRAAPGRSIVAYEWDFGDGTSATGVQVSRVYPVIGTFTVTLVVIDDVGRRGNTSGEVTVALPDPDEITGRTTGGGLSSFTLAPASPSAGVAVTFSGLASKAEPGKVIVSYRWDFGDRTTGAGVAPSKVYQVAGSYNVTLTTVESGGKSRSVTKTVIVVP